MKRQYFNGVWHNGFLNLNTGAVETSGSYPNSVYSDLIYLEKGQYDIESSPVVSEGWRIRSYNADGTYKESLNANGATFYLNNATYARLMFMNGLSQAQKSSFKLYARKESVNKASTQITVTDLSDGRGIHSVVDYYAVSNSNTTKPTTWNTTVPTLTSTNKYLWTYQVITYKTGDITESSGSAANAHVIGVYGNTGNTGATGKGISSITTEFYLSTSKTTQTGSSWTTTMPTWTNGKYLWTRSKIVYINPSSTSYTTPICDSSWEAVNEISVGGINLIRWTKEFKDGNRKADKTTIDCGWSISNNYVKTIEDEFIVITATNAGLTANAWVSAYANYLSKDIIQNGVTISFDIKILDINAWDHKVPMIYEVYDENGTRIGWTDVTVDNNNSNKPIIENGKWTRFIFSLNKEKYLNVNYPTGKTAADVKYISFRLVLGKNGTISFRRAKLEDGTIATQWSPAPEDVENQIDISTNEVQDSVDHLTDELYGDGTEENPGVIDQMIKSRIEDSEERIKMEYDGLIDFQTRAEQKFEEGDNNTKKIQEFISKMVLQGDQFSLNFNRTKGVNLIKNSVMKNYVRRGLDSDDVRANFWLNSNLKEDYFSNIIPNDDATSRATTQSGSYFSFSCVELDNIKLNYVFSNSINFITTSSNIILSYKLRNSIELGENDKFFIGLVFYNEAPSTENGGLSFFTPEGGIRNAPYIWVKEYSKNELNNSFSKDYIYKTLPIQKNGETTVTESLEVQTEENENGETKKFIQLTYLPSSPVQVTNIDGTTISIESSESSKKIILNDESFKNTIFVAVTYSRHLNNYIGLDTINDTKIKEKLATIPKTEIAIFYDNDSEKIWTYNPFTGTYVESQNYLGDPINKIRVIIGIRSDSSITPFVGKVDVSDLKLEYDSISTIWTSNESETYSKEYKMDEKGFSISSDTNTMFIDEDEIAAYKTTEVTDGNGNNLQVLDTTKPVFKIKEDETILRQTTIFDQLNISNPTEDRAGAFVFKQMLINGQWYFIFN